MCDNCDTYYNISNDQQKTIIDINNDLIKCQLIINEQNEKINEQQIIINQQIEKINELENYKLIDIFENLEIGDENFQKIVNKFKNLNKVNKELERIINDKNKKIDELEDLLYNQQLKFVDDTDDDFDDFDDFDYFNNQNNTKYDDGSLFNLQHQYYIKTNNYKKNDNYEIINVIGDGNCQYRCIEHYLNVDFEDLKTNALNFIQENREFFKDFIYDYKEYIDHMKKKNEYGDEITLMAMALENDVVINVYDLDYKIINTYGLLGSSEFESDTKIDIIYDKFIKHYDVIKKLK